MKKYLKIEYLPYLILGLSAVGLFVRAFYSFCWSDESFYFSTTGRFLRGDRIFVHEWFPTQLVSLILLPFQWFFETVSGGTEGVILYFRIVYVLFSFCIALCIYRLLKEEQGAFVSLLAALFYQYYAHLNIATMSYYTLSASCYLMAMLLLYKGVAALQQSGEREKYSRKLIASGVFLALAVLSLPSLAVAYFVCAAAFVIFCFFKPKYFSVFFWNLAGIVIPAVLVLCYVLPTSGLSGLLGNLGYVLSDEEHTTSLVYPFKNFFLSVTGVFSKAVYLSVLLALGGIAATVAVRFVNNRKKAQSDRTKESSFGSIPLAVTAMVWALDTLLFAFYLLRCIGHTGYIGTAFLLFAVPLFFWTEKKNLKLFGLLFVSGMIFSMTYSYSSLCDLYVLCIGHNVAAVGGFVFVADFLRQMRLKLAGADTGLLLQSAGKVMYDLTFAVLLIVVFQTAALRLVNVYRDAPVPMLTEKIEQGPAKGLYTTRQHKNSYDEIYETIKECEIEGKNVFFTKLLPWGYLAADMNCGAPTTWRTKLSSDRLRLYYEVLPEKIPDVIFVLPDEAGSYDTCGDVVADPYPNENEMEGYLMDYIQAHSYEMDRKNGVTVYSRK